MCSCNDRCTASAMSPEGVRDPPTASGADRAFRHLSQRRRKRMSYVPGCSAAYLDGDSERAACSDPSHSWSSRCLCSTCISSSSRTLRGGQRHKNKRFAYDSINQAAYPGNGRFPRTCATARKSAKCNNGQRVQAGRRGAATLPRDDSRSKKGEIL